MHVMVKHLNKRFGNHQACHDVSFSVETGKLVALLGPSGGGKTTILRMIAGLETPDSGEILFHGEPVNDKPPRLRGIGFVFQNYALFMHMTVFDNIAFGLTVRKKSKKEIRKRVEELIELTGLSGLEKRMPHQLSGGQKQRVAFARAIAPEPQLLLLDEPFAAIDAKVRKELRTWLKNMIRRVGITSIFVTHDQDEAAEVADEILIINRGRLEQQGTPIQIYKSPQTPFVASFIGESSTVDDVTSLKGFARGIPGAKAIIRPEWIEIGKKGSLSSPSAAETGIVRDLIFRGANWLVQLEVGRNLLTAYYPMEQEALLPGEEVHVFIRRAYQFTDETSSMLENDLKAAPVPIGI